jgi:putative transposase
MNRAPSASVALRNQPVIERIHALKADHPFWGYRRIWAHLRFVDKLQVNKKRVLRLLRSEALLVKPNLRLKAKRTSTKAKPRPTAPNQWWGIDMTKVLVESFGWIYIVIVLDWYSKKIVGYYAGVQCKSAHWLAAVNMAANRQFPNGIKDQNVNLMSDNGCQPTSIAFMQACSNMGINQAFTSYNNPRGNADTERIMRTIKEECLWLKEWTSPFQLSKELEHWVEISYNKNYLHSSLGYKPPVIAESDYFKSHIPQFAAT